MKEEENALKTDIEIQAKRRRYAFPQARAARVYKRRDHSSHVVVRGDMSLQTQK